MKRVLISKNKYNYLKDDGTYLLDEHVEWYLEFSEGFGKVKYHNKSYNFVNSEGKRLLKTNVNNCFEFKNGFVEIKINDIWYTIDKECNFYNIKKVSFKELYHEYPNKRQELIEIIEKYTYFDVNEYFNI